MPRLDDIPDDVLLLIIDQLQALERDFDESSPLLSLACVHTRFNRVAIPALYKHVVVRGIKAALLPLFYQLDKNEKLAESVASLECHLGPFESVRGEYGYYLIGPRGRPDRWSVLNSQHGVNELQLEIVHQLSEDAILEMIVRLCRNITHLRVPADISWWQKTRLFTDDFALKWLQSVHIAYEHNVEGEGDFDASLLFQIASSSSQLPGLKRLRYDGININYVDGIDNSLSPGTLRIAALELRDAVDEHHRGEWNTAFSLLDLCRHLEEFHLKIRNPDVINAIDSRDDLREQVGKHRATLKILIIDANPKETPIETDGYRDLLPGNPAPGKAWSFAEFECLQELDIPMPTLFDTTFYVKKPEELAHLDYAMSTPKANFGEAFRYTLSNGLPRSLRKLRLQVEEQYQAEAVKCSLKQLLQCRADRFSDLQDITIDIDSERRAAELESVVRSVLAEVSIDVVHLEERCCWRVHVIFD